MAEKFLGKVYDLGGSDAVRGYYDEWSTSYDNEVLENGYATPGRVADALLATETDPNRNLLDFGCGTGLSGQALVARGFTTLDGCDLSAEMLAEAEAKGLYGRLWQVEDPSGAPASPGIYDVITATGVISPGAAPIEMLGLLLDILSPGGRIAFSFNDHALADESYTAGLQATLDAGRATLLFEQYGTHLPKIDLKSTVYVIEKK